MTAVDKPVLETQVVESQSFVERLYLLLAQKNNRLALLWESLACTEVKSEICCPEIVNVVDEGEEPRQRLLEGES